MRLTSDFLGRRPQRLPRFRQRRERQEGDRALVLRGRASDLEVSSVRLGLREAVDVDTYTQGKYGVHLRDLWIRSSDEGHVL